MLLGFVVVRGGGIEGLQRYLSPKLFCVLWFVFGRVSLSKTRFLSRTYLKGSSIQCLRVHRYLKCSNVFF